jgi:hypothetical protein
MGTDGGSAALRRALPPPWRGQRAGEEAVVVARLFHASMASAAVRECADARRAAAKAKKKKKTKTRKNKSKNKKKKRRKISKRQRELEAFAASFDGSGTTWKDALADALLDVASGGGGGGGGWVAATGVAATATVGAGAAGAGDDESDGSQLLLRALVGEGGDGGGGGGALAAAVVRVLARAAEAEDSRDVADALQVAGGVVYDADEGSRSGSTGRLAGGSSHLFHFASLARLASLGSARPRSSAGSGGGGGGGAGAGAHALLFRMRGRRGARFERLALPATGGGWLVHLPEKLDGPLRLAGRTAQAAAFWGALATGECLPVHAAASVEASGAGAQSCGAGGSSVLGDGAMTTMARQPPAADSAAPTDASVPLGAWRTLLALGAVEPCDD